MRISIIPRWLRNRVHREYAMERMAKELACMKQQLNYTLLQKEKLEREIKALTKNPVGASAEAWEQKYLSAISFIFATKCFGAYEDYLGLTEGRDYREVVSQYAGRM